MSAPERPQFTIVRIAPTENATGVPRIDVHVAFPGGYQIFTFPSHLTQQSILAQVRNALRVTLANGTALDKYSALVGTKHDL